LGVFEVRGLSVRAPGAGLRGADLYVTAGEVVGLLGDGGGAALLRTVAGVLAPASGVVWFDGEDVTRLPPEEIAALGIALVPAGRVGVGAVTVREAVAAGAAAAPGCGVGAAPARSHRTETVLSWFPSLAAVAHERVAALPAPEARALAVAATIARGPRLLLVEGLGSPPAVAGLRAAGGAGLTSIVAERVPVDRPAAARLASGSLAPGRCRGVVGAAARNDEVDPAAYDRAFLVRRGRLRPWFAAERAATLAAAPA
jgi:branched-chain amino acid transport system ATP-binding protein